jgi:hypothetical protein
MNTNHKTHRPCPECGSTEIVEGVGVSKTAEAGGIGLSYRSLGVLRGTSPLYADVCRKCGTVNRLFVREPDKPWIAD